MKKGISLIALIITIIVIIILAVITIFGVNGVIEKVREAKILQEISNEKEIVSASVVQAKKEINSFNEETLGKALDNITGVDETDVFADSDNLAVQFKNSERYYLVNKDGVIEGPVYPIEDEYAGDITKNKQYDGSEDKPYQINCIEDLVAFSIMTNGGNSSLGLSSSNFSGKYVELCRTLDFKSMFSYKDYTSKKYGDLNKDTVEDDIRTELTKTDEGCIGFTPIAFHGIFDGNNYAIKNLYEHVSQYGGMFSIWVGAELSIKNLEVSGEIISEGSAGGIAMAATLMENCISRVNINAKNSATGINTRGTIIHCQNYGNIEVENGSYVFGIAGGGEIEDCQNYGTITGNSIVGGIGGSQVTNCQNYGEIKGTRYVGGIRGDGGTLTNCQNYGKVEGNSAIGGISGGSSTTINCINYANVYGKGGDGLMYGDACIGGIVGSGGREINCINYGDVEQLKLEKVGWSAGGIIGYANSGQQTINCCNFGNIKGNTAGGIAGDFDWTQNDVTKVMNCYSVGGLEAINRKGGIVGAKTGYGTHYVENSYWPEEWNAEVCCNTPASLKVTDSRAYPLSFIQSQEFVDILNSYVNTYNLEHKDEEDFIELSSWILDTKTGYPILENLSE